MRGEVRSAVADHEPDPMRLIAQVHKQVACLLGGPRPGGMLRDSEDADTPGRVLDHGQHSVESGLSPLSTFAFAEDG
jgi:hypothetical protein